MVPFLPLRRVQKIVYTLVGGAYLFEAELWAPFIPRVGRTPGSRIKKDVVSWILELGNARLDRCTGWVELREIDDVVTGTAFRAVDDAINHEGLLKKAILHLQTNSRMPARKRAKLWWGD